MSEGEKLLEAIRTSHMNRVKELLLTHDPNIGNFYMPPLCLSVIENEREIFDLLIEKGADVNKELCGGSPVLYAVKYGRLEMLQKLVKNQAEIKAEYVEAAITSTQVECLQYVLENYPMKEDLLKNDQFMYKALLSNNVELIRVLKSFGWNYDVTSEENEPVLIQLVKFSADKVIRELGENGMDFSVKDRHGRTPLDCCSDLLVNTDTLKEVLKYCPDVNETTPPENESVLYVCCRVGNFEKVKILIAHGADPNLRNCYGQSPLDVASTCGYRQIVKCLLQSGAKAEKTLNENDLHTEVAEVISNHKLSVQRLQHIVRLLIRNILFENKNSDKIDKLYLPTSLKQYLSFQRE